MQYSFPPGLILSEECRDLIKRIFVKDPRKRISISGIKQHIWCRTMLPAELRVLPCVQEGSFILIDKKLCKHIGLPCWGSTSSCLFGCACCAQVPGCFWLMIVLFQIRKAVRVSHGSRMICCRSVSPLASWHSMQPCSTKSTLVYDSLTIWTPVLYCCTASGPQRHWICPVLQEDKVSLQEPSPQTEDEIRRIVAIAQCIQ